MDNWREGQRTGHTHEPDDATIQLDGLGRQLAELPGEPAPPDGTDGPVFVDESGRRGKTFRRLGWVLASVCVAYAVTLVLALLGGNSSAPWLPLSEAGEKAEAEQAEEAPAPADTAGGPSGDAPPEPGPSAVGPAATEESGTLRDATPSATSVRVPAGSAGGPSASVTAGPSRSSGAGGADGADGGTEPGPTASTAEPPVDPSPPSPEPEPSVPTTTPPAETPGQPVQEESAP
ncbi:hypothetical protein [Streptomyces sp. NPDC017524]|uniref:hypothetical protein n=1 Tax=unclassified Streptomyces TaxID=2593676 RepID=UPI00379427EA